MWVATGHPYAGAPACFGFLTVFCMSISRHLNQPVHAPQSNRGTMQGLVKQLQLV